MQTFKLWLENKRNFNLWYHGTNSENLPSIKKIGLLNPYLTTQWEIAKEYAWAARGNYDAIILVINVLNEKFLIDKPSLSEPVGYKKITSKSMDDKIHNLFKTNPELNDQDWDLTHRITKTVKYNGVIPYKDIVKIVKV